MKIELIGSGMMGERMGGRLLDVGHDLAVDKRTRARIAALEARLGEPTSRRWTPPAEAGRSRRTWRHRRR